MKQISNSILLVLLAVMLPAGLLAQRTITGVITDAESGEGLIGANILAKGTTTGAVSDLDGSYSIEVPNDATILTFSYTGYSEQEIALSASNVIDVQLAAGSVLDEVVVIGYGTVKRDDATGSIQTVDTKTFNRGAITSPQELLAGKIAGVQITTNSGAPGETATIRIRGGSSLNASNDPLIVVDGVPIDNGTISGARNTLNFINPNDIETFTVLKDASATAIYGSRASNGVILITTKKGSLGNKMRVNYSGNVSVSEVIDQVDVLDANSYRDLITEQFGEGTSQQALLGTANTNWQDQIYESAIGTDHNLSLSGGIADFLPYRLSLGYTNKNGILKTDNFTRSSVALNLNPGFFDNTLQVNFSAKGAFTDNTFANRDAIGSAFSSNPTQPVFSDTPNAFGGYYTVLNASGVPNNLAPSNPLALIEQTTDISTVNRWVVNGSADYRFKFLPELRANLSLGYDRVEGDGSKTIVPEAAFAFEADTTKIGGTANTFNQVKTNKLLEFYLNYAKDLGDSNFDVMGGYSWQSFRFDENNLDSNTDGSETQEKIEKGELFLLSLFGRVNYTYKNFLFTATLRGDASSRFSKENRWGLFPAAAAAYKILDNAPGVLNNLKVRVGYGVTGQQDVGNYYQYQAQYEASTEAARYLFGDEFVTTIRPNGYDINVKWEETTTYNAGVDFSLFGERLYGTLEYYLRKTEDLFSRVPLPAGSNLTNFLDTNVGNLENQGIEFGITGVAVQKKNIRWEVGFNITRNVNEITKLIATDDPSFIGVQVGGISGAVGSLVQIQQVGQPRNSFYVGEQVYDAEGNPIEGLGVDQNQDGIIDNDDLRAYKDPAPDFFYGITSNLTIGNFDFSFAGRGSVGNYVYNNIQSNNTDFSRLSHPTGFLQNALSDIRDIQFQNPVYLSDHFVQDGSFFRIDHITAGYRFENIMNKGYTIGITATVQNPILITDYSGVDPEIGSGTDPGIDNNIYPRTRTILFGVNANF